MEIWKSIPNYEGLYEVSSLGRVKSNFTNKILKGKINHDGYLEYVLCNNKIKRYLRGHQIVAMAFIGHEPCGHKIIIDHINDIRNDNRLENLQMITQRENAYKTQGKYSSKYKGVSFNKQTKKWMANIWFKKLIYLGLFNNEYDAHLAYQNKLKELI